MSVLYVNVIIPISLRGVFTYAVPEALADELIVGKRVVVPFGNKRLYSALLYQVDVVPAKATRIKQIAYILDNEPIVTEQQLKLWQWMAGYYMCGLGDIMAAALPGSFRLSSQTQVSISETKQDLPNLNESELMVLAQVGAHNSISVDQLETLGAKATIQRALDTLFKAGLVEITEEMADQIKPRTREFLTLSAEFATNDRLSKLLDDLGKAPRQFECVMRFIELSGHFSESAEPVLKPRLLELVHNGAAALTTLIQKGVFQIEHRLDGASIAQNNNEPWSLNDPQKVAFTEIIKGWGESNVALLNGITGSGKTLIYAHIARTALQDNEQVLMLVPEISLTTQLVGRLQELLGEEVLVYHSRLSNRDRLTLWMRLLSDQPPKVILGARSAVFLPLSNLALIVVDEEHDSSYKQGEASPFYHARDIAVWLGANLGAKVLLGSATPSIESFEHTRSGKYALANLMVRHSEQKLPEILFSDLRKARLEHRMKADFTDESIAAMQQCLAQKRQVIVFQNRRGYAPYQICESCGWSAECDNCDVHLTYHKYFDKLMCHYCGFGIKVPAHCPQCASAKLLVKGFGTEKIEDDMEILFPEARIGRVDLDTTRKKVALQNIITAFEEGSLDVLVGTQMITKGLDFENVGLVVVMNADSLWIRPDFRAFEKAYQLLTQVAGRAGRKKYQGKVMIQTYQVDHPVLTLVRNSNYEAKVVQLLMERREVRYPPYSRLVRFQVSHPDRKLVKEAAVFLAKALRDVFGDRVLGPEEPTIARVRSKYLRQVFLKMETGLSSQKARIAIAKCRDEMEAHLEFRKTRLIIDVDPG